MLAVAAEGGRAVAVLLARHEAGTVCTWPAWSSLPIAPLPSDSVFTCSRLN
jgi:hypothetical protein